MLVVGIAWAAWALDDLSAYGAATVQQTGRGGPAGAVIRSPEVSFAQRLQPARLRLWGLSMRDTLGWAPLVAVALGCIWTRLRSVGARVALAGALVPILLFPLMRLEPQPRYMLPSAGLFLAAALPSRERAYARLGTLVLGVLAVVSMIYSTSIYQGVPPSERPGHRTATPTDGIGDWPWPARRSWPTRSPVETWGTAEALTAVEAQLGPGMPHLCGSGSIRIDHPARSSWWHAPRESEEWVRRSSPRPHHCARRHGGVHGLGELDRNSAAEALAWVQTHADLEGAVTWRSSDGTGGVDVLGAHHH